MRGFEISVCSLRIYIFWFLFYLDFVALEPVDLVPIVNEKDEG